jgi:DNA-directed RNA polymerase subunit H
MPLVPTTKVTKPRKTPVRRKKELEPPAFKISTHVLIPNHELLPREQAQEITKRFNATPSQFPYILATDPIAKEVGAKPGDFIKVSRKSETAGSSTYFRYVVES